MDYFPHDTNATSDDKLLALRMDAGLEGLACYWAILEKIYANEEPFNLSKTNVGTRTLAMLLGIGFDELETYVSAMISVGLLELCEDGNSVTNRRAFEYIEKLDKKRETARQNGKLGGRKPKRNQRRNQVGTKPQATSGDILNIKPLNIKKDASVGAETEETAPPDAQTPSTAPVCPICFGPVRFDARDGVWRCDLCGDVKEPAYREVDKR